MGRRRKRNRHLPQRMMLRRGAYYLLSYVEGKQRWTPLGRDYATALHKYAEAERGEPLPIRNVDELLSAYVTDATLRLSAKTVTGYRAQADALSGVFGAMRLDDVKRSDVARYMKLRGNVAANRERDLLRAAWNWALNSGLTETPNPMAGMRMRNAEGKKRAQIGYVEDSTFRKLDEAATPNMRALLRFLYLTGMRVGDALRLDLSAATNEGIAWKTGKTGRLMLVAWSPELRRTWGMATGGREVGPVFRSRKKGGKGGHYTLQGIEANFARLRRKAREPRVTIHAIRAKAADDVSLAHAQELLGHAIPTTTQKHYRRKVRAVKPTR